jgi:hypothetical protein
MKNLYFKILITLGLLCCFSANVIFAAPLAKGKVFASEGKQNAGEEKKLDVEEKSFSVSQPILKVQSFATYIPAGLKLYNVKFSLPNSYSSLPDRPPRG